MKVLSRHNIARRAALMLADGMYVNLGVGIPTLVANYIPAGVEVMLQSENGILGVGSAPQDGSEIPGLVNANESPVTLVPGASLFHHADSFMMIRGKHLDLALLGAFEVSMKGDISNWSVGATDQPPAVGGAMDLALGAKEIWVLMHHLRKDGCSRILEECSYPITARGVVSRIFTDFATFAVTRSGLVVEECSGGISVSELRAITNAPFDVSESCEFLAA
jgi:3-oxoadipate CoA-transferase beta subunit